MTLHMSESSLHKVFPSMNGTFPVLETLQLCCSSRDRRAASLPSTFEAPNLRHLQLSDFSLLPQLKLPGQVTPRHSIVTFSLGEVTIRPSTLIKCLASMPHLKVLKIGVSFSIPSDRTERMVRDLVKMQAAESPSSPLALTDLEEFEYQGISDYLEAVAARISAPFLKKLSFTISNAIPDGEDLDSTFKHSSRLINGAADLAFQFARVRFKDGFSIVMDHDELWTGRGAFELRFNHRGYYFNANMKPVAKICRVLVPMPSTVQSLLLEDGNRNTWAQTPEREGWLELLGIFDNVKTLRVAGRFVEEVDKALKPDDDDASNGSTALTGKLLLRLQEIVHYGPESEFSGFVEARRVAGLPVRVVVRCFFSQPVNFCSLTIDKE